MTVLMVERVERLEQIEGALARVLAFQTDLLEKYPNSPYTHENAEHVIRTATALANVGEQLRAWYTLGTLND